ncbi:hypothetical protein AB0P17_43035 [Streptomyces sp. NPDC088124]|uniref:hypothetical protein n=1 Tax=Streptomyces sp. NPDC088124 TaxID=3154654 RepID=UPI003444B6DE
MQLQQIHPNPAGDPGFRLDFEGRARLVHEGYTVDVWVRRATAEDMPSSLGEVPSGAVMVTGAVTLDGVVLCDASAGANEHEPIRMREALEEVLREAVEATRRTVARLVTRVEEIDRKHSEDRA